MTVKELLSSLTDEQQANVTAALTFDAGLDSAELERYAYTLKNAIEANYFPRLRLHCGQFETLFDDVSEFCD